MKKVLFVDDDFAIRDVYQTVFERAGFDITTLENGESIMSGDFEEPDIFIIDKQLYGADGVELCRLLKKRLVHADTPVILFSASPRIKELADDAGADDFLEKPFGIKTLLDMVDKHTGHTAITSRV